jgi:hypothetical protein
MRFGNSERHRLRHIRPTVAIRRSVESIGSAPGNRFPTPTGGTDFSIRAGGIACAAEPPKRQADLSSIGPPQRATTRNGALWKKDGILGVFWAVTPTARQIENWQPVVYFP